MLQQKQLTEKKSSKLWLIAQNKVHHGEEVKVARTQSIWPDCTWSEEVENNDS